MGAGGPDLAGAGRGAAARTGAGAARLAGGEAERPRRGILKSFCPLNQEMRNERMICRRRFNNDKL